MQIKFVTDIEKINRDELVALYGGDEKIYKAFESSFYKLFAYDGNTLVGALRVLSEGVETALLTDVFAVGADSYAIKKALVQEIEKSLINKRVMVYGNRTDLELFESLDYGRCKNAWTYYRDSFDEKDFLPAGFKYENEFIKYSNGAVNEPKNTEIEYRVGTADCCYNDINSVLTKAFFGRPHDINKTEKAFRNSQYSVAAYDDGKLVGVARAVSDRVAFGTILNVAVDPEYQGLSIGKNLVLKLSELIEAEVIVLNTHPGAVGFYNRLKEYRRNKYVFEKHITDGERKPMDPERMSAMFTPKGYLFPDEY